MATKTEAYVDTSALIAFADRSDSHHATFRRAFSEAPPLVTTPLVVAEGHGWFLRRYDQWRGMQFMAMVESMPLTFVPIGADEQGAGLEVLRRFADQNLTLADAVGLHVMSARRITECWSTDFHMTLTGVPLLVTRP